ncbi:hypothetical protein Lalb_Chr01g0023401 [Lupinus albus]|uniref:Uncharacterized protein n=1 Tax=Lupinus albus TaxID=3870 RepID=A0A6A4RBL7_LUPAL|nr:hypothetical protein Lalb_Chr01g0023401 [Lupinus albus]
MGFEIPKFLLYSTPPPFLHLLCSFPYRFVVVNDGGDGGEIVVRQENTCLKRME